MSKTLFFKTSHFAIVGASQDPHKFGHKVLLWYKDRFPLDTIFGVNPKASDIEGVKVIPSLDLLPLPLETSISVITPPKITFSILQQCHLLGIKNIWLQPGSESNEAIDFAKSKGLNVIFNQCLLVLGDEAFRKSKI